MGAGVEIEMELEIRSLGKLSGGVVINIKFTGNYIIGEVARDYLRTMQGQSRVIQGLSEDYRGVIYGLASGYPVTSEGIYRGSPSFSEGYSSDQISRGELGS